MIVLPDEDETPVGAQVKALIGAGLRQSVAHAAPRPGFAERLAAALDAVDSGQRGRRGAGQRRKRAGQEGQEGQDGQGGVDGAPAMGTPLETP